eukprot:scaffold77721_cov87-Attheya_sp.AAC.2
MQPGDKLPLYWKKKSTYDSCSHVEAICPNPWVKAFLVCLEGDQGYSVFDSECVDELETNLCLQGDHGIVGNWLLYYRPTTKAIEYVTNLNEMSSIMQIDLVKDSSTDDSTQADHLSKNKECVPTDNEEINTSFSMHNAPIHFLMEFGLKEWPMTTGSWSLAAACSFLLYTIWDCEY